MQLERPTDVDIVSLDNFDTMYDWRVGRLVMEEALEWVTQGGGAGGRGG
jgi:hypothetical protein